MRILKHIAMAGFIAFLLSPEKSRQREDIRDHSIDVVVVIDDTGCVTRVLTCSLFESIKVSKERSISFIAEHLGIKADCCLLNGRTVLESDYDRPLSELIGSDKRIAIYFMNKIDNA